MKEYRVKVLGSPSRTEWRNLKGQLDRTEGPAIEYICGSKEWWVDNQRHREDGPAIEYISGVKRWFLNGIEYTEEQFNKKMSKHPCDGKTVEIDGKKYKLELL